ncbi:uncharacterized protein Xbp1 isoform X1 [Prorops nasuta]|uniref:uncharacterized protein Xbp1 isoform X1 n=1 Tax=Prorops nasuta TaxID=863751 RepID=UPI0034CEBF1B
MYNVSRTCRLYCAFNGICSVLYLPSAEGWNSTTCTVTDTHTRSSHSAEDPDPLPPLEELFGDLQGDDYIERLEELAESLLREVTAEVEANSNKPNAQVPTKEDPSQKCNNTEKMVGQASKDVETDPAIGGIESCRGKNEECNLDKLVSVPSLDVFPLKNEVEVKQEVEVTEMEVNDTVYGTYDEATNCITIIYPEENDIQDSIQEVCSDSASHSSDVNYLTPNHSYQNQYSPYTCTDSMSPASIRSEDNDPGSHSSKVDANLSDGGYESHDSPIAELQSSNHTENLTDLWHESFSELFPSLA